MIQLLIKLLKRDFKFDVDTMSEEKRVMVNLTINSVDKMRHAIDQAKFDLECVASRPPADVAKVAQLVVKNLAAVLEEISEL